MSIGVYIWGLSISTMLALATWIFVIFYIDPNESGIIGKFFFYTSFFLFISGFLITVLVWLRKKFIGKNATAENIGLSFRQGILLATFLIIIAILFGIGYLIWWNALLVLVGIFLIELHFLSKDK